jgi:microcompartment protein CcmL/EutN
MIHRLLKSRRAEPAEFRSKYIIPRPVPSVFELVAAAMKQTVNSKAPARFPSMIMAADPSRRRAVPSTLLKPANDI